MVISIYLPPGNLHSNKVVICSSKSSIHRSARNRFLLFLCPPNNKGQRAQHKNRSHFLLVRVYVCSFFSFSPDVRRLHHHLLPLRHRLLLLLLLLLLFLDSTTMLDLCVSVTTTIITNSLSHSFSHSLTTVHSLHIELSTSEQK